MINRYGHDKISSGSHDDIRIYSMTQLVNGLHGIKHDKMDHGKIQFSINKISVIICRKS